MSRLREHVGRSLPEGDLRSLLAAGSEEGWAADWDGEWAATQARAGEADDVPAEDTADQGTPGEDRADEDQPGDDADARAIRTPRRRLRRPAREDSAPSTARRRPPGRRAPFLVVVAVLGALLTAVLGGVGSTPAPVASAQDYGLGVSESSFAGGVGDARGVISQAEAQARLNEIAASRAAREPDFVVPTVGRLTTCFCMRWGTMHWGLDLAAPLGTPIVAAADGVVLRAGPASGYGYAVYIQDADGNVQIYGHMRYMFVEAGDVVSAGDLIAKVGNQGQSTGPHLHFEIHEGGLNGDPIDPQEWLAERGVTVG